MEASDAKHVIVAGATFVERQLDTLSAGAVRIPDPDRLVHLQLRRFAGCPVCDLHLRSFVMRHDEIAAAGIREVVVFHSTVDELRKYEADLPFDLIADPTKQLYRELGVESSPKAVLSPRFLVTFPRVIWGALVGIVEKPHRLPPVHPTGGSLGLPADFLIASDGRVLAVKYGEHAYDQWSVDELLAHAASAHSAT